MNTDGIAEFLAVARAGTFTGAAQILNVSIPHVSRQVSRLEERLGACLFKRSTRLVPLTPAGERLRVSAERISDDLEVALSDVSKATQELQGRLRIASMSGTFADQVVGPALVALAQEHPELSIEIDFNARKVDILREGYDLAIRSGVMEDSGLIAKRLASRVMVAAASKDYIAKHGMPEHPNDLAKHECITTNTKEWLFVENGRCIKLPIKSRLHFNSGPAVLEACENGLGIAYMASAGYEKAFSQKHLVPILYDYWHKEQPIYAVRADRQFTPQSVRFAIQKLEEVAKHVEREELAQIEKMCQ